MISLLEFIFEHWFLLLLASPFIFIFLSHIIGIVKCRIALTRIRRKWFDINTSIDVMLFENYPKVHFEKYDYNILSSLDKSSMFDFGDDSFTIYKNILNRIVELHTEKFLQADINLNNLPEIPLGCADDAFFIGEENNRITKNKRDPKDWSIRRSLVYQRDNKYCLRCGTQLRIDNCHIHHIMRRADNGDHSLNNLATLCHDCHTLMDGHELMRAFGTFYISRGKIHTSSCKYRRGSKIVAQYINLRKKGFKGCKNCEPWREVESSIENYTFNIQKELKEAINKYIIEVFKVRPVIKKQPIRKRRYYRYSR